MKAWSVMVKSAREFDQICLGPTAGKVRYQNVLAARDAGYEFTFADFRVKRAPWCDTTREQDRAAGRCPTCNSNTHDSSRCPFCGENL